MLKRTMPRTLLIEARSGKVLNFLNKFNEINTMPEVLTLAEKMSEGPFYPARDQEGRYIVGDVVDFEFLLVQGNITSGARIVDVRKFEPDIAETQAYCLTTIIGIKGKHKVGDKISL